MYYEKESVPSLIKKHGTWHDDPHGTHAGHGHASDFIPFSAATAIWGQTIDILGTVAK